MLPQDGNSSANYPKIPHFYKSVIKQRPKCIKILTEVGIYPWPGIAAQHDDIANEVLEQIRSRITMTGLVCDSFIFLTIFPNIKQLDFPVQIVFFPQLHPTEHIRKCTHILTGGKTAAKLLPDLFSQSSGMWVWLGVLCNYIGVMGVIILFQWSFTQLQSHCHSE